MNTRSLVAIGLVAGLAGCGGSGADSIGGDGLPGPSEFNDLILEGIDLNEKLTTLEPSETIPGSGSATYNGVFLAARATEDGGDGILGDMSLEIDFFEGDMTGDARDFYYATVDEDGNFNDQGVRAEGIISLASDSVSTGAFPVVMAGSVFFGGTELTPVGIAAGGLFGEDGDMVKIDGDLVVVGTPVGLPPVLYDVVATAD